MLFLWPEHSRVLKQPIQIFSEDVDGKIKSACVHPSGLFCKNIRLFSDNVGRFFYRNKLFGAGQLAGDQNSRQQDRLKNDRQKIEEGVCF